MIEATTNIDTASATHKRLGELQKSLDLIFRLLADIDDRQARLEAVLGRYQPLLDVAAARMSGPMKWRKT